MPRRLVATVIRRHVILQLQHHDRFSLLAGKLHALLQRPHFEGRDIYDLVWFLSDPDWPEPNLTMLNNAVRQTGWEGPSLTEHTWRDVVGCVCQLKRGSIGERVLGTGRGRRAALHGNKD